MEFKVQDSSGMNLNIGDTVRPENDDIFKVEADFRISEIHIKGLGSQPLVSIVATHPHGGISITASPETFFKKRGFTSELELRDKNHQKLELGDIVWYQGVERTVGGFAITNEGVFIYALESDALLYAAETSLHIKKDSWERFEEDMRLQCEDKLGLVHKSLSCSKMSECEDCLKIIAKYFTERAKAIAEMEKE